MKKLFFLLIAISILAVSCKKDDDTPANSLGDGVFVLNQGVFNKGNASLSYFYPSNNTIVDKVFNHANKKSLGDVAQSITQSGNISFIVVNNSGLIYAIDNGTAKIKGTIKGLSSPRYMLIVDPNKAYVSDLTSTEITIVDPSTYTVTGSIPVGRTTEGMVQVGSEVFAANWSAFGQTVRNDMIVVVNTLQDMVVDSIRVGLEPNSIVVDKYGYIWVLCSGGYDNQEIPSLWKIDSRVHTVIDTLIFDTIVSNPGSLSINGSGDMMYYLNKGIYRLNVDSTSLPVEPFIEERSDRHYAFIGVDPVTGDIYASDPLDYQKNGVIFRFRDSGVMLSKNPGGIIPGFFGFNYH